MSDLLFQVLLPMCLTGCLFALGVLLVFPLLRRLSARWRRAALLATVTLFILPLPLLFAAQPAQAAAQDTPQPKLNQALQQAAPTAPVYQAGQALNTATRPQQATGDAEADKGPAVSLPQVLTLVYLAGFGLYVAATGLRYLLFVRRLRRGCTPAAPQSREAALLAALCEEMDIRRPPGLYHSNAFLSPVLAGLLQPRIVLPADPASASQCEPRAHPLQAAGPACQDVCAGGLGGVLVVPRPSGPAPGVFPRL